MDKHEIDGDKEYFMPDGNLDRLIEGIVNESNFFESEDFVGLLEKFKGHFEYIDADSGYVFTLNTLTAWVEKQEEVSLNQTLFELVSAGILEMGHDGEDFVFSLKENKDE